MDINKDRKEFQAFFEALGRKPHVLINPFAFAELQGIFMSVFDIMNEYRKFQFPKDLFSGKFTKQLADPFKDVREKARAFKAEYLDK